MAERVDIPPPPLTARLLGRTELRLGDRLLTDADWPRRSARHLLLLLLISPGHALPRDRAIDLLWPEAALDSSTNLLALAVHCLRRVLEPGLASGRRSAYVDTASLSVRLRLPPTSTVDADAFEVNLATARRLPDAERRDPLRAALAAYAGDLVADEPYLDWLIARRERLAHLRRSAAIELARLDLTASEPLAAEPALLDLLRDDPADETAHRALIGAYAAAGQRERAAGQLAACRTALADSLGVEPSPETVAAAAVPPLSGSASPAASIAVPPVSRVPAPPTRLIGRSRELEDITDALLGGESRLVTLVGPGGIGKTHLAQEAARALAADFADGAAWVPLAALDEPGLVPAAVANALKVRDEPGRPLVESLVDAMADRALLLVVDNLEQVIAGSPVLSRLLAASPRSAVLATSRLRLNLRGEWVLEVPPLPPTTDGVALFAARAAAAGAPADRDGVANDDVVEICRRLDGLPLAIELAAAASPRLRPEQILQHLGRRLDLLVDGPRDADPRQRTMRTAIAWSDELLSDRQRSCFRRLAVFAGSAPRDLIGTVVGAPPLSDADAIDAALAALVEAHLVRREEEEGPDGVDGGPRYLLLETIRAYALERLEAAGELEATAAAHAHAVAALAERADLGLVGPDQVAWLDRLEADHDNLRTAVNWAIGQGDPAALRIVAATWRFFSTHGHGAEWADRADHAVAVTEKIEDHLSARGLRAAGILRDDLDDYDGAESRYQAALDRLPHSPDTAELRGQLANDLGNLDRNRSRYREARAHYEEAVAIAARAGLPRLALSAESNLANLDMFEGRLDEAADRMRALLAATEDQYFRRILLSNLSLVHLEREDYPQARTVLEEALAAARMADDREGIADALAMLANALDSLGEPGGPALREEAVERFAALSDRAGEAAARIAQIDTFRARGDRRSVFDAVERALSLARDIDDRALCIEILEIVGSPLVDVGRVELAARLLHAADDARQVHSLPRRPKTQRTVDDLRSRLAMAPTTDADVADLESGGPLPLDAAVQGALTACRDLIAQG